MIRPVDFLAKQPIAAMASMDPFASKWPATMASIREDLAES